MDVATVKQNYLDSNASNKSTPGSAEQIMGDFSAAVAKRMMKAGAMSGVNGKNALVSALNTKSEIKADPRPRNDPSETVAPVKRNDDPAPRNRNDVTAPRDRAPVRDDTARPDAPRDTSHASQPSDQKTDAPKQVTDDGRSKSDKSANDGNADVQTTQTTDSKTTKPAIQNDGQVTAVQQINTGQIAEVVSKVTTKTKTGAIDAKATTQNKNTGQGAPVTQNNVAGKNQAENTTNGTDDVQKAVVTKGKATAAQASTTNTHLKTDAQAGAEKGATAAQQQAADLAKKIGSDQALKVNVTVTKQADELVSKPSANLAGSANVKAEGESLTPTTAQPGAKVQGQQTATHTLGGQNGGNADTQGQTQQQAQFQAAQADAIKAINVSNDAKSSQSTNAANATQAVKVGGAESISSPQAAAPSGATQQTQQATVAKQPAPAHTPNRAQVTEQVTVQISKAISDGVNKIRIQLKPAHLGRVDVQLDVNQDGRISAVISADNKDTLDLLKQDSRELERALREAGIDLSSGDLSFNLRGENGAGAGGNEMAQNQSNAVPAQPIMEPTLDELLAMQPGQQQIISEDRVDITA